MGFDQSAFEQLRELRTVLQRFLRWTEDEARTVGLTPTRHQLLLAIKGHPDPDGPTIGQVADYLAVRHHSAVGLIDRAERDGLVRRNADPSSKSIVRVTLTATANEKLDLLAEAHRQELAHLAPMIDALCTTLDRDGTSIPARRERPQRMSLSAAIREH